MTRPITDTLRSIQGGALVDEATDKLRELMLAVEETGKGGKLLLEVSVAKLTRGGAMTLKGRVKTTMPAEAPAEQIFWLSPDGDPLSEDPSQQKLDLKVAPAVGAPSELRQAG